MSAVSLVRFPGGTDLLSAPDELPVELRKWAKLIEKVQRSPQNLTKEDLLSFSQAQLDVLQELEKTIDKRVEQQCLVAKLFLDLFTFDPVTNETATKINNVMKDFCGWVIQYRMSDYLVESLPFNQFCPEAKKTLAMAIIKGLKVISSHIEKRHLGLKKILWNVDKNSCAANFLSSGHKDFLVAIKRLSKEAKSPTFPEGVDFSEILKDTVDALVHIRF